MARTYGGNADFYLGNAWVEAWLDSITMNFSVGTGDITAFGDVYQNVVAGKKNTTLELSGKLGSAAGDDFIFDYIGTSYLDSKFEPTGSVDANNPSYNCTAALLVGTLISSYNISLPVGDSAKFTDSLQNSGSTLRAVV